MGNAQAPQPAVKELVEETIRSHKVVMFSKSTCPYCMKAKSALATLLKPDQWYTMELNQRPDGSEIQDVLAGMTGARTVPRVFIDGHFIGGGDDTARKARNGELQKLLTDCGVLTA